MRYEINVKSAATGDVQRMGGGRMTVYISRNGRFIHQAAHIEGGIVWGVLYEVNDDGSIVLIDNWYGFKEKEIAMYWREMR